MYSWRYPCESILRNVKSPSVSGPLYRYRPAVEPLPAGETPLKIEAPVYTVPSWFRYMLPPMAPTAFRNLVFVGASLLFVLFFVLLGVLLVVFVLLGLVLFV